MTEPARDPIGESELPTPPLSPLPSGAEAIHQTVAQTGAQPVPAAVFPPWSLWDVGVVLSAIVVAVIGCSVVALAFVHRWPAYRNVSIITLSGNPLVTVGAQVVAYPVVLGFIVLLVRSRSREPFFKAIRWNWPPMTGVAFLLLGTVLAISVEGMAHFLPIPKSLPIDKFFNSATAAYLMAIFGTTLAPLLEEMFFRGLLYPVLRRSTGIMTAVVLTAAAFAGIHGAQLGYAWAPIVSIFVVGVVLTLVRERTDSVAASFLTHCGYNFTLFAMLWIASDHFRQLEKVTS